MFYINKRWASIIVIIFLMFDLLLLFFIKYNNQDLSLIQFRFSKTGNILNLLFFLVSVVTIIIYSSIKRVQYNRKMLINFAIIISAILIIASVSTVFNFPVSRIYILDHPLNRIIIGGLFFIFQFAEILFIIYLWLKILGTENVILTSS